MCGDINYKSNFVSYLLADVIIFVYEVPFIFWRYINITKCDRIITNCDRYYKVRWIYYKLRRVLQRSMIITNCNSTCSYFGYPLSFQRYKSKKRQVTSKELLKTQDFLVFWEKSLIAVPTKVVPIFLVPSLWFNSEAVTLAALEHLSEANMFPFS